MAGGSKEEVEKSPFVERLFKKGYEVLYLTEAVDEYAISALPEVEGGDVYLAKYEHMMNEAEYCLCTVVGVKKPLEEKKEKEGNVEKKVS